MTVQFNMKVVIAIENLVGLESQTASCNIFWSFYMNTSRFSQPALASTFSSPAFIFSTINLLVRNSSKLLARLRKTSGIFLALLVLFGAFGLFPQFIVLWHIWTLDPLRSIGMLIMLTSIILVLRAWRQRAWELRGSWWGLLPIVLSLYSILISRNLVFIWNNGDITIDFLPVALQLYLYASGVILLFAGARVWREAWFPLGLMMCAQPVPTVLVQYFDFPLQNLAAYIARAFAVFVGFPPTNSEMLRLMFTPDFGMFIAPGCDGMRGAVTLGYIALVVGYLKRVSVLRWILYVSGAVFLGHIFNLIRLCSLVLYYRIASGTIFLEHIAKQADYVIGGCLFIVAAMLFIWSVFRKDTPHQTLDSTFLPRADKTENIVNPQILWKVTVFTFIALIVGTLGARVIKNYFGSLAASLDTGGPLVEGLSERIPNKLGNYSLIRTWQEQYGGKTVLENATYAKASLNEITIGIWLSPIEHNIHDSWKLHGERAEMRAAISISTANNVPVTFDTAYYSDGVTDSFAGNTYCSPSHCRISTNNLREMEFRLKPIIDFTTRGQRFVPIYFRVEIPHSTATKAEVYKEMIAESQEFLSDTDLTEFSKRFQ